MEYFLVLYIANAMTILPEKYSSDDCIKAGVASSLSYRCVPAPIKSDKIIHLNIDTYHSKLCTADMKHCE